MVGNISIIFSKKKKFMDKIFVIAEIGHNHQGDINIAKN